MATAPTLRSRTVSWSTLAPGREVVCCSKAAWARAKPSGKSIAGCTIHFVDASLDGGPIILQSAVAVHDNDDAETLRARILEEEHRIVARAADLFARGRLHVEGRRVMGVDE